ncbi:MAG: S8 family serine peptidase [Candidatus Cloacimonadia bacterium]
MLTNRKVFTVLIMLCIAIISTGLVAKPTDALLKAMEKERSLENKYPVIVVLRDQYDTNKLYSQVKEMKKSERREYAVQTLKRYSQTTQSELRKMLEIMELDGAADNIRYNWIVNTICLEADSKLIKMLSERADIAVIEYDPLQKALIEPVSSTDADGSGAERAVTWNLTTMRVPEVWELGYYGQGVLVSVIDTGINYNHHDIKNRMWVHEDYPNHGWSFIDNSDFTMDIYDHGTHCAGSIAGDGTSGRETGVAPQSKIMNVKVYDPQGHSTQSIVIQAIEFSLEHKADILSMSLGWYQDGETSRTLWRQIMNNVLSVGVPAMVAAGNEAQDLKIDKPIPRNIRTPGDCPPPWLHPDQSLLGGISSVISVGATNSNDVIGNFSSIGPVTWADEDPFLDYPFDPEMGLIRPDITAPGVNVISLAHDDVSGYSSKSGTSMATPNAAGVAALLLSKDPELTPEDISRALELTAKKITDSKDNTYGTGRINALAAIKHIVGENPPNKAFHPYPADRQESIPLTPTLTWFSGGGSDSYLLYLGTDDPPTNLLNGVEVTGLSYEITEPLDYAQKYYWRIDAVNEYGTAYGDKWSFLSAFKTSEDFEDGAFEHPDWKFLTTGAGAQEWYIDETVGYMSSKSARSGEINHSSTTIMSITLDVLETGVVKFARKVSSEKGSDFLRFYIGNDLQGEWSGEEDWAEEVFTVLRGINTLRWVYSKDQMNSQGSDAAWVDMIVFPRHPKPPVPHAPKNIEVTFDYESYKLDWEVDVNEDIDPIAYLLLGYDIYRKKADEEEFTKLNEEYLTETSYKVYFDEPEESTYYLVAAYRDLGKLAYSNESELIEVVVNPPIEAPVIDPVGGEYNEPIEISFAPEEGVDVFYTLDGAEPNFNSTPYVEPFTLEESGVIRAIAYKLGYLPSETIEEAYEINLTSVTDEMSLPIVFGLTLYPNPYTQNSVSRSAQSVSIQYALPEDVQTVNLDIYNIKGQLVKSFREVNQSRGVHTISWSLDGAKRTTVGSGIYLVSLQTEKKTITQKFMVIK